MPRLQKQGSGERESKVFVESEPPSRGCLAILSQGRVRVSCHAEFYPFGVRSIARWPLLILILDAYLLFRVFEADRAGPPDFCAAGGSLFQRRRV